MVQLLVILICPAAIITGLFKALWRWVILAFPAVFLLLTLIAVKQKKWRYVPELSNEANKMLQRFGHFYTMPFGGNDFSSSASTLAFAGVAMGIIGVFKGF